MRGSNWTKATGREVVMPTDRMQQFFVTGKDLEGVSLRGFDDLAAQVVATFPANPERTVTLRKLLEAKDAAARTLRFQETQG